MTDSSEPTPEARREAEPSALRSGPARQRTTRKRHPARAARWLVGGAALTGTLELVGFIGGGESAAGEAATPPPPTTAAPTTTTTSPPRRTIVIVRRHVTVDSPSNPAPRRAVTPAAPASSSSPRPPAAPAPRKAPAPRPTTVTTTRGS